MHEVSVARAMDAAAGSFFSKDSNNMHGLNRPLARRSPPVAERRPTFTVHQGVELVDEYAWLRAANWQEVMRDPGTLDPKIRAYLEAENAYAEDLGNVTAVDPEVRRSAARASRVFRDLGCRLEVVAPRWPSPAECWYEIFCGGIATRLAAYRDRRDDIEPGLGRIVEATLANPPTRYVQAWFDRLAWWQHPRALFERYDLLLTPTVACPPFAVGLDHPGEVAGKSVGRVRPSAIALSSR